MIKGGRNVWIEVGSKEENKLTRDLQIPDYKGKKINQSPSLRSSPSSRRAWVSSQCSSPPWTIPGFTPLRSSVIIPGPSSEEYPWGLQRTAKRFLLQLPCENGFGGGGPGMSVLCAWFRIYEEKKKKIRESVNIVKQDSFWQIVTIIDRND